MPRNAIRHDGEEVQIRVWVPAEMYAQIAMRAEDSGVSKAAITRDLMTAGLRADNRAAQELDHLERLAYKGALQGLIVEELVASLFGAIVEDPAEGKTFAETHRRAANASAIARLKKYLREAALDD